MEKPLNARDLWIFDRSSWSVLEILNDSWSILFSFLLYVHLHYHHDATSLDVLLALTGTESWSIV